MADSKVTDLAAFTPVKTDILYGVDDPSGTPTSGKFTIEDLGDVFGLEAAGETVTADTPVIDQAQTWNAGAVTFTGVKLNVTNTASASASMLYDFQVAGTSMGHLRSDGNLYIGGTFGSISTLNSINVTFTNTSTQPRLTLAGTGFAMGSSTTLSWRDNVASNSGSLDTGLKRSAANVLGVTNGSSGNGGIEAAYHEAKEAYTVATLPTASVGMIARVTDANSPSVGSTVSGGGAAAALVWYNGSNWTAIGV